MSFIANEGNRSIGVIEKALGNPGRGLGEIGSIPVIQESWRMARQAREGSDYVSWGSR
jgi:hypothetical protein